MVQRAQRHVILADHSKIGQASRVCFCDIGDIDVVVTDARSRRMAAFAALQAAGCDVVIA